MRRPLLTAVVAVSAVAAVLFAPMGDWLAEHPLPGQSWMREHLLLSATMFGAVIAVLTLLQVRSPRDEGGSVAYTGPDGSGDRWLSDLRVTVRKVWIDQVLARSLAHVVPTELNFAERADLLTSPVEVHEGRHTRRFPHGTSLMEIFDDENTQRRLLVVGDPGSGKTTQMLQLAEALLERPDAAPVVLPLSTGRWRATPSSVPHDRDDKALAEFTGWLVKEIATRYDVPRRRVQSWVEDENSPLILLLDGLDEIADGNERNRCAATLALVRRRLTVGMVVSCRIREYEAIGKRLNFGTAVVVLPLESEAIDAYLTAAGPDLSHLRSACTDDVRLTELFRTPLTLGVAMLAYRNRVPDPELLVGSIEQRLRHLWAVYLDVMLLRRRSAVDERAGDPRFPPETTRKGLRSIARMMAAEGRTDFSLSRLGLTSLPRRLRFVLQGVFWVVWAVLAVLGLARVREAVGHLTQPEVGQSFVMLTGAVAVIYAAVRVHAQEGEVAADWDYELERIPQGLGLGALLGLLLGLFLWVLVGPIGLLVGLVPGPIAGLLAGMAAVAVPLPDRKVASTRSPTLPTFVAQLATVTATVLTASLLFLLIRPLFAETPYAQGLLALMFSPAAGIVIGSVGLGFTAWWSHRTARIAAVGLGLVPRRLGAFLRHTDERILMRPAAGGYQFLHLSLRDHLLGRTTAFTVTGSLTDAPEPAWARVLAEHSVDRETQLALYRAEIAARDLGHDYLGTEHLLLGLARADSAPGVLDEFAVTPAEIHDEILDLVGAGTGAIRQYEALTVRALRALQSAVHEAGRAGVAVLPEHLLTAIVRDGEATATRVLTALRVPIPAGNGPPARALDDTGELPAVTD
ncbi:Clp protease N-terminal domain-containing protein [Actinoplanes sp. NPDC051861]|uniref:NACHT domain-containing protein n=1 Tax=Actinoplanes sp. NPDC051861 TaxID=3155170 RepID=UPI00341839D3